MFPTTFQLREWMEHAGLAATVDGPGNVRGRAEGSIAEPTVFTGSHYDTVIDGGNYDGSLGIIAGIAATKAILLDVRTCPACTPGIGCCDTMNE